MKRFALAIALTCVLSGSVLAGDAHTVGAPAPVAPPAPGDMGSGGRKDGDQTNGGRTDDDGNQGAGGFALLILDLLF
jgi:hypothetical protein